jgi:transcription initiation factor TFIIB
MIWNVYDDIQSSMVSETPSVVGETPSVVGETLQNEDTPQNKPVKQEKQMSNHMNNSNKGGMIDNKSIKIKIKIKRDTKNNLKNTKSNVEKNVIQVVKKVKKEQMNPDKPSHIKNVCFNCNKNTLIAEENIVCTSCGMINNDIIDGGAEWRYYGSEDSKCNSDPNRCGMPVNPLLPKSSFSTIINGSGREEYRRLHKWNSMTYSERSLIKVFNLIRTKSNAGIIPNCIVDKASLMYKLISTENIKRGVARRSLIAACIWFALKAKKLSRSMQDIADLFEIDVKRLTVGCKDFTERMQKVDKQYLNNTLTPTSTIDYIQRYSVKLNYPNKFKDISIKISGIIEKLGIVTKNTPQSIAVSSLYLTSMRYKLGYTKKQLHVECNTSEVTISKAYKELNKYSDFLFQLALK